MYVILTRWSIDGMEAAFTELEELVESYMEHGWKPTGGIAFSNSDGVARVMQAMIKEEE